MMLLARSDSRGLHHLNPLYIESMVIDDEHPREGAFTVWIRMVSGHECYRNFPDLDQAVGFIRRWMGEDRGVQPSNVGPEDQDPRTR